MNKLEMPDSCIDPYYEEKEAEYRKYIKMYNEMEWDLATSNSSGSGDVELGCEGTGGVRKGF